MSEATITLYGASDDCVCLSGVIQDEAYANEGVNCVAFSDGTIARIEYTRGGLWKITILKEGSAKLTKIEATDPDSEEYSDKLTLEGNIEWAVCGSLMKAKEAA